MSDLLNSRYRLISQLGRGGFSKVWKAFDERAQHDVAVKMFIRQDTDGVKLCREEFIRTNRLVHPNIIRLTDFGDLKMEPFIVMPFFKKGTTQDYVGEMKESEIWRLIHDIGSALDYVHNQRPVMLHNDLKPDNFLIADDGSYVLTDFGISMELAEKLTRSLGRTPMADDENADERPAGVGPRAYRAPELFHFKDFLKRSPVKATDIWSFGACLYELATGEPPFGDQGGLYQLMQVKEFNRRIEDIVDPLPSQFSHNLQNIIYRCLDFQTWDRPIAAKLVEESRMWLETLGGGAPNPIPSPRVSSNPYQPPVSQPAAVPSFQPRQNSPVHHRSVKQSRGGSSGYPANSGQQRDDRWWVVPLLILIFGLLGLFGVWFFLKTEESVLPLHNEKKEVPPPQPQPSAPTTTDNSTSQNTKKQKQKVEEPSEEESWNKEISKPSTSLPKQPVTSNYPTIAPQTPKDPPKEEFVGKPDRSSGYHLVVAYANSRETAVETIGEYEKLFPGKRVWASRKGGFDPFSVKIGSFSSHNEATEFHRNNKDQFPMAAVIKKN